MIPLYKLAGRLGNNMYQFAYIYTCAREMGLDGHFPHSPHWFKKYEREILSLFREDIRKDNRVSIHVRRTDYISNPVQYPLSMDYYEQAMKHFPGERFLVFSDDIAWCQSKFIGPQFDFSVGKDEIGDMNAMAGCKHNIIANSTFSTWAAMLNPNQEKIVIAPARWERTEWNPQLPDNWIRI